MIALFIGSRRVLAYGNGDLFIGCIGHIKLPLMRPHLRCPETGLTKGIRLAQCRSFELPGDQIRRTVDQETFVGTLIVRAEQIVGMVVKKDGWICLMKGLLGDCAADERNQQERNQHTQVLDERRQIFPYRTR